MALPMKNAAYTFSITLVDADGSLAANPTLAAGDVQVSKDDGSFANLTTLPTVTPASGRKVKVSLSATEMNADRVDVQFVDQTSPKAWKDVFVTIQTVAASDYPTNFEDMAITATTGRVDVGEWLGNAVTFGTGGPDVNVNAISDDTGAATNLEADYDGTGYNKSNSTIGTCTTNSDMRGTDSALLAASAPTNWSSLSISVGGAVDADLIATQSNTVTFPAVNITGLLNIDDGIDVSCTTGNRDAVKLVGNGSGDGLNASSATSGSGIYAAGAGNGHGMALVGAGTGEGLNALGGSSGHGIQGQGGGTSGGGLVLISTGTNSALQANASASTSGHGISALGGSTSGDGIRATLGGSGVDIRGDITGDITGNLSGSVGSLTGHTVQTGDTFARLGAPAGASVSADIAAVKAETANIVADTNELQGDWANGGRLDLILDELTTNVDAVETDTQDIQSRLPAALVSGRMSSDMVAISGSTPAADNLEASALGIISGTAQAGTLNTTTMTSDLTGYANDELIGRVVVWTGGTAAGQASDITDYASASGTVTYTAITTAPANNDTFVIV